MDNNGAEHFHKYRNTVIERTGDFSFLFQHLRRQKPSGDGWVAACCPFHDDHDPSFVFNRHTGAWACFAGCGKGSPFDFLMVTTGQSFKDVLYQLGDRANVPRPNKNGFHPNGSHPNGSGQPGVDLKEIERMEKDLQANPSVLRYLKEKRGLTDETIKAFHLGFDKPRNRIAIPVFDENGKAVNIRLYAPKKKPKIQNLKGFGNTARLFGLDKFIKAAGKQVFLCEGEFDCMLLHQNGFPAVTSTHGCSSFRKEWTAHFDGRDLRIVYDCDEEGQSAVQAIVLRALKDSKVASVKNIVLPLAGTKDDKDITDYFTKTRPMGGDLLNQRAYTAQEFQQLVDETPPLSLENVSSDKGNTSFDGNTSAPKVSFLALINSYRSAEDLRVYERNLAIAEATVKEFSAHGAFFFDPSAGQEFLCREGKVFLISNNRAFNALMQSLGRFNITTPEGRYVWEFLRNHAREKGTPLKSAGWVYGDPMKPAVYVHTHDESGRILKISPRRVELIPNGQNADKLMLNPSDRVQPYRFMESPDLKRGWELIRGLMFDSFPCSLPDKIFLVCYAVVIFLKDFCPVKPLLRLGGPTDSGKTTAAKIVGYLLHGEDIAKTGTIASFYTDASKNPLSFLDNLELVNFSEDLINFLLTVATGIVHEKKKLYTDQDIVRERATAFIVSTGIESLGKLELLNRQWDIACDSKFHCPGFAWAETIKSIQGNRDLILSTIFHFIAHKILPQLSMWRDAEAMIRDKFKNHPKDRTFECLALIIIIWDALEEFLGVETGLWQEWIKSQHVESVETFNETSIILQFFGLFKGSIYALQQSTRDKAKDDFREKFHFVPLEMAGRTYFETDAGGLLNVFSTLARQHGVSCPFENAKQLMARLKESLDLLKGMGWGVESNVRKLHGDRFHRFWLPSDDEKVGALGS